MTVSEPAGGQQAGDDTPLLTAALDHTWAWYDARYNRALQVINFYLVAAAITFNAYIRAINGNHYGVAAALAISGLTLSAIAALAVLHAINAGARAEPALAQLQDRVAARLGLDSIRMATTETPIRHRRAALIIILLVLPAVLDISGLIYAVVG
jgi:hypothetical protein